MTIISACPQCAQENIYPDGDNHVCADCGYEWPMMEDVRADDAEATVVKDANGNVLTNGDAVVLIKDLKVKGSSITLKVGYQGKEHPIGRRRP